MDRKRKLLIVEDEPDHLLAVKLIFEGEPDVEIYEVGPRDGLQNESDALPTQAKLELIRLLEAAGLSQIEVTSFVSPEWIPQLADADELVALVNRRNHREIRLEQRVPNRIDIPVADKQIGVTAGAQRGIAVMAVRQRIALDHQEGNSSLNQAFQEPGQFCKCVCYACRA